MKIVVLMPELFVPARIKVDVPPESLMVPVPLDCTEYVAVMVFVVEAA